MATVRERQRTATRRVPRLAKPVPAEIKEAPQGLCVSCNHSRTCAFRRNPGQPVLYCEEFDSYTPPTIEELATEPETAPTSADLAEWDQYKGLCVNCENRHDCAIRDKEIGVWHCEEYA